MDAKNLSHGTLETTPARRALSARLILCGSALLLGCGSGNGTATDDAGLTADAGHSDTGAAPEDTGAAPPDAGLDAQGDDAMPPGDAGSLGSGTVSSGMWSGTATVSGDTHLATGTFPARVALARHGSRIRGVLEIEQNAGLFAEAFVYWFEGTDDSGTLTLELTDRFCSNGDVDGLCHPNLTGEPYSYMAKVFVASGQVGTDGTMTWTYERVVDSPPVYPPSVPIEPPFTTLSLSLFEPTATGPAGSPTGVWSGPCFGLMSVALVEPFLFGDNQMEVGTTPDFALVSFDNRGINIYPARDDLILPDTFDFDESTGRLWFTQVRLASGTHWLYAGSIEDDRLVLEVLDEPSTGGAFDPGGPPSDPATYPFHELTSVCVFVKN